MSTETAKRGGVALTVTAVLVLIAATHFRAFEFPFYVDDFPQLHEAQELTRQGVLLGATHDARGVRGVSSYFRPTLHLSFWLDAKLFGFQRWGFHLTSLLLHAGTSLMLLALGRRLRAPRLAVAWAVIFAVHPAKAEAVYWIAARGDLLVTFFAVLAAWCLVVARSGGHRLAGPATVVAATLAMTSKESGMVVPIMLVLLDVLVVRGGRRRWLLDVSLIASAVAVWVVRRHVVGIEGIHYVGLEMELGRESIERALRRYPEALAQFICGAEGRFSIRILGGFCALAGVLACPWRSLRPAVLVAGAAILGLALPPALVLLEPAWVGVSRHFYLPGAVVCLALAVPLLSLRAGRFPRIAAVAYLVAMTILVLDVPRHEHEDVPRLDREFRAQLAGLHPRDAAVDVGVIDMPIWVGFGLPLSLRPPFESADLHVAAVDRDPATLRRLTGGKRPMQLLRWVEDRAALESVTPAVVPPRDPGRRIDVELEPPARSADAGTVAWPRDVAALEFHLVGATEQTAATELRVIFTDEDGRTLERTLPWRPVSRVTVEDDWRWFGLARIARIEIASRGVMMSAVRSLAALPRLEVVGPAASTRHSYSADGDLVIAVRDPVGHAAYRLSFTEPVPWTRTILREHCEVAGDLVRIPSTAPAATTSAEPAAGAMSGPEIMRTLNLTALALKVTVEALDRDLDGVRARSRPVVVTVVP